MEYRKAIAEGRAPPSANGMGASGTMSPMMMSPGPGSGLGLPGGTSGLNVGFSDSFDMGTYDAAGTYRSETQSQGGETGSVMSPSQSVYSRHVDDVSVLSGPFHGADTHAQLQGRGHPVQYGVSFADDIGIDSAEMDSVESEIERANREYEHQEWLKREKRKKERRDNKRPGKVSIPWRLLDELEGEKIRFQKEQALASMVEDNLRRKKAETFIKTKKKSTY